ncbi:hypothetical protein GRI62_08670 [Erythrobacter arachoides]|uniref:Uncharacterized protein n=1 Tax=Aurantiacibacter arachoides TaxID=1850444 RepID=A0A845A171_9SPHN|nr:hypothetical protein [Aurantiacibacter arachoides]MXO93678.1 hypothetical protein [Aurantiacibacter arachoides]GGD47482.1 hypothetical protein GCM10011411_04040 [Aurantiacibacter arachoides]
MRRAALLIGASFAFACAAVTAQAQQQVPTDLATMPPVADDYVPGTTAWGDPDFRGTWPLNDIAELPVNRPAQYGDRFWKTPEEIAAEQGRVEALEGAYASEDEEGTIGLGHWIEYEAGVRRTSMIVSPADGRLPALTAEGIRRSALMRGSWTVGQTFDWVTDFDSWDRCVSRGFPASMFPFRYNNGIRIFQSPGYVVIQLEMLGTRIIPVSGQEEAWPVGIDGWFGHSTGRWVDGNTLEVVTTRIQPGASLFNTATRGVPANNTIPMSAEARVVERFSMVGPDTITYEMDYADPVIWAAPFTTRVDWTRDDSYEFFEYACHEGNVQVRNYITANRTLREQEYARGRMVDPIDPDAAPPPAMDPASRGVGRQN